jgi:hypothetical protein
MSCITYFRIKNEATIAAVRAAADPADDRRTTLAGPDLLMISGLMI